MTDWDAVWKDQAQFNAKFRPNPLGPAELADQVKDIVLHMQSELHELLNTVAWKKHRSMRAIRPNMAHTTEELVDVFKYFVTLCIMFDVDPEVLMKRYWEKSAVCEQRYIEEWVSAYARKEPMARVAFVDLDNVIFDYVAHFGHFVQKDYLPDGSNWKRIQTLIDSRAWLSAESTGIDARVWASLKHRFRVSGQKARMPLMPGAKEFLEALKTAGYVIIVMTSRPIDRYPNLMTDTVSCLQWHHLPYDHIWHGRSKFEVLSEMLDPMPATVVAIDDDADFIKEYVSLGLAPYHVTNGADVPVVAGAIRVQDLAEALNDLSGTRIANAGLC